MKASQDISLIVSVPICGFRKGHAREYLETERVPPPSTVYGFLLSLVGEEDRSSYIGTRIAYALMELPPISTVLRTVWRFKTKKVQPGIDSNRRPDYQEILTGLELFIRVYQGPLADRIAETLENPGSTNRYGGLSLGESRDLVNDIRLGTDWPEKIGLWLISDREGDMPLPVWVDHVGSKNTIWRQFRLMEKSLQSVPDPEDKRWITIRDKPNAS